MTPRERVQRIANGASDYPTGAAKCSCDGLRAYTCPECIELEITGAIVQERERIITALEAFFANLANEIREE